MYSEGRKVGELKTTVYGWLLRGEEKRFRSYQSERVVSPAPRRERNELQYERVRKREQSMQGQTHEEMVRA